jgi:hypothetical protein
MRRGLFDLTTSCCAFLKHAAVRTGEQSTLSLGQLITVSYVRDTDTSQVPQVLRGQITLGPVAAREEIADGTVLSASAIAVFQCR